MSQFLSMRGALAILAVLLLGWAFGQVLTVPPPKDSRDAVMILIGAFIAIAKDVYAYFFGTSKSSADKNDLIASATDARKAEATAISDFAKGNSDNGDAGS